MRACFLGSNVCALGYGVAVVQFPPLPAPGNEQLSSQAPQKTHKESGDDLAGGYRPSLTHAALRLT